MEELEEKNSDSFELRSGDQVVEFLKSLILENHEDNIDLTLISLILGFIENGLTTFNAIGKGSSTENRGIESRNGVFPVVSSVEIMPLVDDFRQYIQSRVTRATTKDKKGIEYTDRKTIKDVATAVWKRLGKSFHKDKPHCQTLYTFKNGGQLDCFGLAYAIVAGCQVLGCNDVRLCLSEDHAWITFGPDSSQTAEITWHGKQNEILRGEAIDSGLVPPTCWLYLGGKPVLCRSRRMEATAVVAMMNSSIDNKTTSDSLGVLKRDLLWMLYDAGCMSYYPMALCVLAEEQEHHPLSERQEVGDIYHQAIDCARAYYGDNHVYPYSQYGCFLYREKDYEQALFRWQQAANVLRKYNYNREEEELYKEMKDIADNYIPTAFRSLSDSETTSFFQNTENLINFLLFYDGICEWEQNGTTPVLHAVWAKSFTQCVNFFDFNVRKAVLASPNKGTGAVPVIAAPLPHSPVKNVEDYRKSLIATVLNVYGNGRDSSSGMRKEETDEFIQLCETSKIKADLIWKSSVTGSTTADIAVASDLKLCSRKMNALKTVLTKPNVRLSDVDLQLAAQIEPTAGNNDRRIIGDRKKQKTK